MTRHGMTHAPPLSHTPRSAGAARPPRNMSSSLRHPYAIPTSGERVLVVYNAHDRYPGEVIRRHARTCDTAALAAASVASRASRGPVAQQIASEPCVSYKVP